MDVSTPRIQITLTKTMDRQGGVSTRFQGADRVRDLTRYLGEQGVVRTHKSLAEPAGGFTIAFPDQPDAAAADSLYGLVEPMDLVEIRMGRDPGLLPLVMRGFVVAVSRAETIGQDGMPQRSVLLQGHDYGVLLRWIMINWRQGLNDNSDDPSPFFTPFKLQSVLGISGDIPASVPAGEFVKQIVEQGINPWLSALDARNVSNAVLTLAVDADSVTDGEIGSLTAGAHENDLWSLLAAVCDLDWNELFVEDREDAPTLVYRPRPWRDVVGDGKSIMPGAKAPDSVSVTAAEVRDLHLTHASTGVVNWVWVDAFGEFDRPVQAKADAVFNSSCVITPEISPNSDKALFGQRLMQRVTAQYPAAGKPQPEAPYTERQGATNAWLSWRKTRRDQLIALHKDNVVYEDGQMTVRGRPDLGVGKVIQLTRGSFTGEYYAVGVAHTFSPFRDWTTQVEVARGTGFLERMRQGRAPVWMEGRPGVYA